MDVDLEIDPQTHKIISDPPLYYTEILIGGRIFSTSGKYGWSTKKISQITAACGAVIMMNSGKPENWVGFLFLPFILFNLLTFDSLGLEFCVARFTILPEIIEEEERRRCVLFTSTKGICSFDK